jgi:3-methylcrotonyl-CoA carboxylase beta subunit
MGGPQAASTLLQVRMEADKARGVTLSTAEQDAFTAPIRAKYEAEGNPYYATARLWDDGIIDPADTRAVLAIGLAAARYAPPQPTRFGVFRM